MKEIDFLPSWYRNSRRRSIGYKWQYGIITVVFAFMVGWSFIAGRIVSSTTASVSTVQVEQTLSDQIEKINIEIEQLKAKDELIKKCNTNVKLSSVIAELSFLVEPSIVLKRLQINSEDSASAIAASTNTKKVINRKSNAQNQPLKNNKVYKVVITGVAKTPEDVAKLIFNLEDSSYFMTVIPNFSQNVKIKDYYVTEFELSCYIANYQIKANK